MWRCFPCLAGIAREATVKSDNEDCSLPPGQQLRTDFPRFGLPQFVNRFPDTPDEINIRIHGDVSEPFYLDSTAFERLNKVQQISDFHCVTTWSCRGLQWGGYLFSDFFNTLIADQLIEAASVKYVVIRCQDGYRVCFCLSDLLADSVLLANSLNGEPLTVAHGAPIRLVAPALYGYKNARHVSGVEFMQELSRYKPVALKFMEHPRARVAYEERGKVLPGWILRYLYRPFVRYTIRKYSAAYNRYQAQNLPD